MNVRMDRLEQVLQETIELEELAELDVEYYGLEELRKRFEIFDNVKNEAFQIENDNELSSEQKARIDKITDIAYENANKFNVIIEKKEAERSRYYNYYTGKTWGEAKSYDICINSSILGIENTATFLADYIRMVTKQR